MVLPLVSEITEMLSNEKKITTECELNSMYSLRSKGELRKDLAQFYFTFFFHAKEPERIF